MFLLHLLDVVFWGIPAFFAFSSLIAGHWSDLAAGATWFALIAWMGSKLHPR